MNGDMPKSIGEYSIMRPVAKGLMGTTYVATKGDNVYHAIKVLDPRVAEKLPWATRFAGEVQDPHILGYKAVDLTPTNETYFVSEYLELKPASRKRLSTSGGGMSSPDIVNLMAELAESMQRVHEQRLAHGNLKTSNILVRRMGGPTEAFIADFGMTYVYDPQVITGDRVARVFSYMSPERIKQLLSGASAKDQVPTPPMDIYSMGVSLCEILTGSAPYSEADTPEEMLDKKRGRKYILVGVTSPVRRLDIARLNEVVARSAAYDPYERFSSMREFAAALRECIIQRPGAGNTIEAAYGTPA